MEPEVRGKLLSVFSTILDAVDARNDEETLYNLHMVLIAFCEQQNARMRAESGGHFTTDFFNHPIGNLVDVQPESGRPLPVKTNLYLGVSDIHR